MRLVIFNGYQKSAGLLAANAAPRQLTVTVRGAAGTPSASKQLTLERKMGPQSFDIPVNGSVSEVVLTIDSVHPGAKYRDTCVSDVQVFVDSDVKYNAQAEGGKRKALLEWKKSRLADAKYYASLPKTYPFVSTHFESKRDQKTLALRYVAPPGADLSELTLDDESLKPNTDFVPLQKRLQSGAPLEGLTEQDRQLLGELEEVVRTLPSQKEGRWYTLSFKKRVVLPENFEVVGAVRDALELPDSSLFEAKGQGTLKLQPRPGRYGPGQEEARSNVLLLEGTASDLKKVFFTYKTVIAERSTTTRTARVLALYAGGRLARMVTLEESVDDSFGPTFLVNVVVPTYREGKLTQLSTVELEDVQSNTDAAYFEGVGLFLRQETLEAVVGS